MKCLTLYQLDLNSEISTPLPSTMPFTIGRSAKADIQTELLGKYVSRFHVRVTPQEGCWRVEDLASCNGIFNNLGEKVPSIVLENIGDNCWIAARKNYLGAIRLAVEDSILRDSRETIRLDLKAWISETETSIDQLQELIDKERS